MKWYHGLEPIVEENVRLADRTWYRLGGAARYFCTPASITEVCEVVKRARDAQLPLKVLGGGANVLVRDEGFDGIVMQLGKDDFGHVTIDHNKVRA
ncbi:MAG: FAD-binding protein, partial [Planctomycetes bacterium]|nr:FAD-binding protein [Planctomycetota bacterium]